MLGLLAPAILALPAVFGVQLGQDAATVRAGFAPVAEGAGTWTDEAGVLTYRCEAQARCFALPAEATFRFRDGRLVQAELLFAASAAPPGRTPAEALQAATKDQQPAATARAVGRDTRYFVDATSTLAVTLDAPDARLVLALDAEAPIPRAEAVSAGAPAGGLDAIPGARAWQRGHAAVIDRRFDDAVKAFEAVLGEASAPAPLAEQAPLLLAMSLAARASATGPSAAALADLARARTLAPGLAEDLDALRQRLTPAAGR
ncbi:MAG: hypothetical protein R3F60_23830 [bacterium]